MWTPSDWVLFGTYCPEDDIRRALEKFRKTTQSSVLVHIAAEDAALLRGLSFVAGADQEVVDELETALRTRPTHGSKSPVYRQARALCFPRDSEQPADASSLPEAIATETNCARFADLHVVSLGRESAAIRSILLLEKDSALTLCSEAETSLATKINATPQAEARRDLRAMEEVGRVAAPTDRLNTELLQLAKKVTGSSGAALYLRQLSDPYTIELVGQPATDDPETASRYPTSVRLAEAPETDLVEVLDRQKYIHSEVATPFAAIEAFRGGAELLCPLPWTSALPDGPAAGVLVLHKSREVGSFSAHDRALARNVTLRLGMQRYTESAGCIAKATSALRRGSRSAQRVEDLQANGSLPSDVVLALPTILPSLEELANATQSHSVSLRLLLPHPGVHDIHGMCLMKAAAYPASEMAGGETEQKPDEGANWNAVESGVIQIIDDVRSTNHYTEVRRTTLAELSVPVRAEGRLIGTLNLESPYVNHYRALAALVEAYASGVGRTLVDASTIRARTTLTRALALDNLSHDLKKHLEEAEVRMKVLGLSHEDFDTRLSRSLQIVERVRAAADTDIDDSMSVLDLMTRAAKEAGSLMFRPHTFLEDSLAETPCSATQAAALLPALRNLIVNMKEHAKAVSDYPQELSPDVESSLISIDGRKHFALQIVSTASADLDRVRVADLYRLPVIGTRRPGERAGAYLAGAWVRGIRGFLTAAVVGDDCRSLRTNLVFPLERGPQDD